MFRSKKKEEISRLKSQVKDLKEQRDRVRSERDRFKRERNEYRQELNRVGELQQNPPPNPCPVEDDKLEKARAKFEDEWKSFKEQSLSSRERFEFAKQIPFLNSLEEGAGKKMDHYFFQDLWVARRIFENSPEKHVDVGSRVDGFVAHVASFRSILIFDIRNVPSTDSNIEFVQADLMNLDPNYVNYCDSLSCLHAIEHFGLGRYGDPIDYEGHLKGIRNMAQIVRPGGKFYLSTPIGRQRVHFNAHRVFSVEYLVEILEPLFRIDEFSYVDDQSEMHARENLNSERIKDNFGCHYGCGIFETTRR